MRYTRDDSTIKIEQLIADETKRLSEKFDKLFLDCEDIIKLTGLGRDNARTLMNSKDLSIMRVGNRQVVSILAFVTWQMRDYIRGNTYGA